MVILGIGIASVLSLSTYLSKNTNIALNRNKINFLSEMMMETLIASESTFASQVYSLDKQDCTFTYNNSFQKIWLETFRNVLDTNTTVSKCLEGDEKKLNISNNGLNVSLKVSVNKGMQQKHLGYSIIEGN